MAQNWYKIYYRRGKIKDLLVLNFCRSAAKYLSCEVLSWHSCRSTQYPERFSELWSCSIGKSFWAPGKPQNLDFVPIWEQIVQKFLLKMGKIHGFSNLPGGEKHFSMGYDHNSTNLSGYWLDLQLCQLRASHDTYFAVERRKFHTPPLTAGSGDPCFIYIYQRVSSCHLDIRIVGTPLGKLREIWEVRTKWP